MKILSHASLKKKTKMLKGLNFLHFYWVFLIDKVAMRGLICKAWVLSDLFLFFSEQVVISFVVVELTSFLFHQD